MNASQVVIENPYAEVVWEECQYVHSMSHQHCSGDSAECEALYAMGYRHFAFSNYYPSAPVASLPETFRQRHPRILFSPNAEHHSFTDTNLHCNALGSLFASGYGSSVPASRWTTAPLIGRFEALQTDGESGQPYRNIYRLDITLQAKEERAEGETERKDGEAATLTAATLTVDGALKSTFANSFAAEGVLHALPLVPGAHSLYLRALKPTMTVTLDYDESRFAVRQFRLMQGTNRPWRDVFRAALDELKYPDGGGITLNHPSSEAAHYLPMLDCDPRVLGVEVWNYRRGFGAPLQYYEVWNEILRTGRRCWGFFVKDHHAFERGRNVLLLAHRTGLADEERERAALRAYRQGAFFGSVAAPSGQAGAFDRSDFRFTRLAVRRDMRNRPVALEVSVAGQDTRKRPNIQLRFITARGIELIADAATAEFSLEMDRAALLARQFLRVEAFAYPDMANAGEALSKERIGRMNVAQIAALQDYPAPGDTSPFGANGSPAPLKTPAVSPWNSIGESPPQLQESIPVVDMIFSQPLRFLR